MKFIHAFSLLLLSILGAQAQQVFVNPTSVTLTKQEPVTIIVTDNKHSSMGGSYATVGTLTATYTNAVSGYASNQGFNYITASSASTGTLNAGTYTITTYNTPLQVTVILWGESTSSSFAIQDIALAYNSASTSDQAAFQSFITSLIQTQLTSMQSEINSQQSQLTTLQQLTAQQQSTISSLQQSQSAMQSQINSILGQITTLQQSDTQQQSAITGLQQSLSTLQSQYSTQQSQITTLQDTVATQQTSIAALQQSLSTAHDQYTQLSDNLTTLTDRVSALESRSTGNSSTTVSKSEDDLMPVALGLGAAGVIGSVINFFTQGESDNSENPILAIQAGSEK